MTMIGSDRPGLVELMSKTVTSNAGNWEASRMARLANRFAGILLIKVEAARADALGHALRTLEQHGLKIILEHGGDTAAPGGRAMHLELVGGDRPGITRAVTQALAARGVNVEELATSVVSAPDSGEPLFHLDAELRVPADVNAGELRRDLEGIAGDLMVDLDLEDSDTVR